jgi:hypothetical protein
MQITLKDKTQENHTNIAYILYKYKYSIILIVQTVIPEFLAKVM